MRRLLIFVLISQFLSSLYSPSHATDATIDVTKPSNYLLGICTSEAQLDCLEPLITVTHKDGTTSQAELVSSSFKEPFLEKKNLNISGMHGFKYKSGDENGYFKDFLVSVSLATPGSDPLGNLEIRVVSVNKKLKQNECDENLSKLCTRYTLDPEDNFKIVVRSQNLPVHWIGVKANRADVVRETYLTGNRWILTGAQELIGWNPGLTWSIASVGKDNSSRFFKDIPRCSQFGVLYLASNSVTGGLPSWNSKTNSLNFGIFGPHFDANGDLYNGFFKARIPKRWLDCTYPENTLASASQVVINIIYEDGTIQVATTHTKVTDDVIYIEVPVLHFSSPTIQVVNAAQAKPSPTPKRRLCKKGKVTKPLTGSKCPSGWKLVA